MRPLRLSSWEAPGSVVLIVRPSRKPLSSTTFGAARSRWATTLIFVWNRRPPRTVLGLDIVSVVAGPCTVVRLVSCPARPASASTGTARTIRRIARLTHGPERRLPRSRYSSRIEASAMALRRFDTPGGFPLRLLPPLLEQLDQIPGRILDQDLIPSDSNHELAAERHAGLLEALDLGGEILHDDLEAVPSARFRRTAIGQRLTPAALPTGRAQKEGEVSAREHRERRRRVHVHLESELVPVEADRRIHVVDDVSHVHSAHGGASLGHLRTWATPRSTCVRSPGKTPTSYCASTGRPRWCAGGTRRRRTSPGTSPSRPG